MCVLFLCHCCSVTDRRPSHLFPSFPQSQFAKQYLTLEEESYRMSVYEQNQAFIDSHNEQYENGYVSYTLKMNQFGDMVC